MKWNGIIQANSLEIPLANESVQMCVTSPPYWGLRAYEIPKTVWGGDIEHIHEFGKEMVRGGPAGNQGATSQRHGRSNVDSQSQSAHSLGAFCTCGAWLGYFGLEPDPYLYVEHAVWIFREIWRVLKNSGTLWLNLGDCYASGAGKVGDRPGGGGKQGDAWGGHRGSRGGSAKQPRTGAAIGPMTQPNRMPLEGLKPKDLVGIPWRVALALQSDGWYLRSDIIWSKKNPMPESVTDRPTKAHEYIFLLTKQEQYLYNGDAIKEQSSSNTNPRRSGNGWKTPDGWNTSTGDGWHGSFHRNGREHGKKTDTHPSRTTRGFNDRWDAKERKLAADGSGIKNNESFDDAMSVMPETRNKRSVWDIGTQAYHEAHYATFPEEIPEICIRAGSNPGDVVLDPFFGSGTVGMVSERLGRRWVGLDLGYQGLQKKRVSGVQRELILL